MNATVAWPTRPLNRERVIVAFVVSLDPVVASAMLAWLLDQGALFQRLLDCVVAVSRPRIQLVPPARAQNALLPFADHREARVRYGVRAFNPLLTASKFAVRIAGEFYKRLRDFASTAFLRTLLRRLAAPRC